MTAQRVHLQAKRASSSRSSSNSSKKLRSHSGSRCLNNPRVGAQVHAAPMILTTTILASIVFDSGTEKPKLDSG